MNNLRDLITIYYESLEEHEQFMNSETANTVSKNNASKTDENSVNNQTSISERKSLKEETSEKRSSKEQRLKGQTSLKEQERFSEAFVKAAEFEIINDNSGSLSSFEESIKAFGSEIQDDEESYEKQSVKRKNIFGTDESKTSLPYEENDIENTFAMGDNLEFMRYLIKKCDMAGKIDMIYIDPPFFSKSNYDSVIDVAGSKVKIKGFEDSWHSRAEYLKMLCVRLFAMKELLADTGSIWVHLDWHVVHTVKVLMDEIFGEKNFINEVIWTYKSGGTGNRRFSRKHDTLLFYGKTKDYYFKPAKEKSYNRNFKPYRFKGVKEYEDETGWYTLVNKKDVWNIDMVGRTSHERTGYATQKPVALLDQIIDCCTKPGDICADFFAGSGVLAKSAMKNGRKFIACDCSGLSMKEHIAAFGCDDHMNASDCEKTNNNDKIPDDQGNTSDRENINKTDKILNAADNKADAALCSSSCRKKQNIKLNLMMEAAEYEKSGNRSTDMIPDIGYDGEIISYHPLYEQSLLKKADIDTIKKAEPDELVALISEDCDYDGTIHKSKRVRFPSADIKYGKKAGKNLSEKADDKECKRNGEEKCREYRECIKHREYNERITGKEKNYLIIDIFSNVIISDCKKTKI